MTIEEAKNIKLEDYLHSLGYNPVKRQGMNLWYKSPFREETDASFKVNTEINKWYDFGLGKGGNILTLASVLYCSESVPYLLRQIEEQAPHICTGSAYLSRFLFFSKAVSYRAEFSTYGSETFGITSFAFLSA